MDRYQLKLYVTGTNERSMRAVTNLRRVCQELGDRYEIIVINVLEDPQLAEDDKILATPVLVKTLPPPLRRVIGDLSRSEDILLGLDLKSLEGSIGSHD